jgi:hypothetical protein
MARAPELCTTLSACRIESIGLLLLKIDGDMTRRDNETIVPETHAFCMEEAIVSLSSLCTTSV